MYYVLYMDVFFVENLVMDYFLIRTALRLMKCSATHLRSLAAAALVSAMTCFTVVFMRKYLLLNTILVSVAATALMVRFGCKIKDKKRFLQGFVCMYLAAFLYGALYRLLLRFAGTEGAMFSLLLGTAVYAAVTVLLWAYRTLRAQTGKYWKVVLYWAGTCKEVKGLYDTGNGLWDATYRRPVSVICYSLIRELFSGEIQEELQAFCQYGQAGKPELLAALHPHYIPFRPVGNQGGFLPAVTLDYLYLENGNTSRLITRPVIAIEREHGSSPRSYQMILNPNLINS